MFVIIYPKRNDNQNNLEKKVRTIKRRNLKVLSNPVFMIFNLLLTLPEFYRREGLSEWKKNEKRKKAFEFFVKDLSNLGRALTV